MLPKTKSVIPIYNLFAFIIYFLLTEPTAYNPIAINDVSKAHGSLKYRGRIHPNKENPAIIRYLQIILFNLSIKKYMISTKNNEVKK